MKQIIPSALLGALFVGVASAASTTPVGYTTETLSGKVTGADPDVFNLIGVTLHQSTLAAGSIDTVGATSITDTNMDFTAVLGAGTYILEITTGDGQGVIQEFTTYTATEITGIQNLGALGTLTVEAGDQYRVRKAATVQDIFGDAATTTLTKGTSATADIVWVSDGAGGFARYYVAPPTPPFVPTAAWTKIGGGTNPQNDPIIYTDGVIVQRRGVGNLPLVIVGELKIEKTVIPVAGVNGVGPEFEYNYFSSVYPTNLTINETTESESTVASLGLNALMTPGTTTTADILWLPNGAGGYTRYFNNPPAPPFKPNQTFDIVGGASNVNPATIEVPSGFILQRRGSDTSHSMEVPAAYQDL